MSWTTEHGQSYQVPAEVAEAAADLSYRNDTCPSFGMANETTGEEVRMWVEHPDPTRREYGEDAPRYALSYVVHGDGTLPAVDHETLLETDDVAALLAAYRAHPAVAA